MVDFILFILLVVASYLACAGFVVTTARMFFPVRSKEEWAKHNIVPNGSDSEDFTHAARDIQSGVKASRQLA